MKSNLVLRVHAIQKMFERAITIDEVRHVLQNGEILREYLDDKPFASRLMFAIVNERPIHVVASDNEEDDQTIVITAYEPTPSLWEADFKHKKQGGQP
jgi:hypothetical protein